MICEEIRARQSYPMVKNVSGATPGSAHRPHAPIAVAHAGLADFLDTGLQGRSAVSASAVAIAAAKGERDHAP
jgi:hypothetical protein